MDESCERFYSFWTVVVFLSIVSYFIDKSIKETVVSWRIFQRVKDLWLHGFDFTSFLFLAFIFEIVTVCLLYILSLQTPVGRRLFLVCANALAQVWQKRFWVNQSLHFKRQLSWLWPAPLAGRAEFLTPQEKPLTPFFPTLASCFRMWERTLRFRRKFL